MGWLSIGTTIAKAIIAGVQFVERAGTPKTGEDKRALALQIAKDAFDLCHDAAVTATPEVAEAMKGFNDSYVALQNAIAKASLPAAA